MDERYLERFRERSAYESDRSAPPPGFPALPDIPLGRYTELRVPDLLADWVERIEES